jgi:hypothetical protein
VITHRIGGAWCSRSTAPSALLSSCAFGTKFRNLRHKPSRDVTKNGEGLK